MLYETIETTAVFLFASCVNVLEYQIFQWFSNFSEYQKDAPENLIKTEITRHHPQVSDQWSGMGAENWDFEQVPR